MCTYFCLENQRTCWVQPKHLDIKPVGSWMRKKWALHISGYGSSALFLWLLWCLVNWTFRLRDKKGSRSWIQRVSLYTWPVQMNENNCNRLSLGMKTNHMIATLGFPRDPTWVIVTRWGTHLGKCQRHSLMVSFPVQGIFSIPPWNWDALFLTNPGPYQWCLYSLICT